MNAESIARQLAVLAYHKVGDPPQDGWDTWHYIPVPVFVDQLRCLSGSSWNVIDEATFLAGIDSPDTLPERSVLLTFDDGHRSFCQVALSILRQFNFPAVCFVPTDYIGKSSTFDAGVEPEEPMCDWGDLLELESCGVAVQSHGASHSWFSLLNESQKRHELVESKRTLEKGLRRKVELFAFPYSDADDCSTETSQLVHQAGYRAAFLCGGGPSVNVLPIRDRFHISRLAMYRDTDLLSELADGRGAAS